MAYDSSIPQATDLISTSQGDILANFTAIDPGTTDTGIGFARNHITMTDATNGGLHNRVDYYAAVTSPTISGFTSSAYAKTTSSISEFFYKNGTADTQITSSGLTASSGEGFIPGGLQIRVGTTSISTGGNAVVFSTAFPTGALGVWMTNAGSTAGVANVNSGTLTVSGFTASCISGSGTVYYLAIGY